MIKRPLLILHGALGCAKQFDEIRMLLEKEFVVHCYDLKGHGSRCDGTSFIMQDLVDDTVALMHEKELMHCPVFGYSMGGYIALQLCIQHPSMVSKVFTLGTRLKWTPEIAEKENAMLHPEIMSEKVPHYVTMLQNMHGAEWKQLVVHTGEMMRNLALFPLTADEIKSITVPVRLGLGDQDNMVTSEETTEAFHMLQNGSLLVIPDCKHPIEKVAATRLSFEIHSFF
jgi:pimeloyl-ACP methyl ester carboxylesterase